MCGIAGVFDPVRRTECDALLKAAIGAMRHRGPDETGLWHSGDRSLALGHARLKVIDLQTGHQPFSNEAEDLWLAFNGEIYNHAELRAGLEKRGHHFKTRTDCEVILHLYEEVGERCVEQLQGMFAFAVADAGACELFLARDRFGQKPLFLGERDTAFYFSSELCSFVSCFGFPNKVDEEALELYLSLGYIPAPWSIFRNVRKLEPAATLLLGRDRTGPARKYWELAYAPKLEIATEDAVLEFGRQLERATRLRLRADVPVGCFLSGGIDSTAVAFSVDAMRSMMDCRIYTVAFDAPDFDETAYAKQVAAKLQGTHRIIRAECESVDALVPQLVLRYGEPFADSSAIPTWMLSKAARQEVTVALCGDGGDELFAGYARHRAVPFLAAIPAAVARAAGGVLSVLPGRASRRTGELLKYSPCEAFFELNALFGRQDRPRFLAGRSAAGGGPAEALFRRLYDEGLGLDLMDRLLRIDTLSYLPGDLLAKVDVASMAHGLEVRAPFLDHELQSFGARLPVALKSGLLESKRIVKKHLEARVSRAFLKRRKMGFGLPIRHWFKDELAPYAARRLRSPALADLGLLRDGAVDALLLEHQTGRRNHQHRLWALIMLASWAEAFL